MSLIVLLLFITSLVSQQALCQDGDKANPEGDGHQRTIYSQRHLSPHKMMHFGKRPEAQEPPMIQFPQVFEPMIMDEPRAPRRHRSLALVPQPQPLQLNDPYLPRASQLFEIKLGEGHRISLIPEGELSTFQLPQPIGGSLYNFGQPQAVDQFSYNLAADQQQQPSLRQVAQPNSYGKLMKLLKSNDDAEDNVDLTNELVSAERAQPSANAQEDNDGQFGSDPQQAISVSTRSMQAARHNSPNLPKSYISTLLYGRQGSSLMPNFGSFNKKAENTKGNSFMHFGRK